MTKLSNAPLLAFQGVLMASTRTFGTQMANMLWMRRAMTACLHPAKGLSQVQRDAAKAIATPAQVTALSRTADLVAYPCVEWGDKSKKLPVKKWRIPEVLTENDFLAGSGPSVACITAFAGLAFADFAKAQIPENPSNLTVWRAKVAARPSIAG